MTSTGGVFDRLRQPEYTGENRCLPCTVVNTVIAAVLAAILGVATATAGAATLGLLSAVGFFTLSLVIIYLRGYLVPKTPELTKQYFPAWLLGLFGKEPGVTIETGLDPETTLQAAGALEECENEDDLCLAPAFREEWYEEIDRVDAAEGGRTRLLELLGVDEGEVSFENHGEAFQARVDGTLVGRWESEAAFRADLAAARSLAARIDNWTHLSVEARSQLLSGLRIFLDRCPTCGGVPTLGTERVESCCTTHEVAAVTCEDCDARLFESRL